MRRYRHFSSITQELFNADSERVILVDHNDTLLSCVARSHIRDNNSWHRASYVFIQEAESKKFLV